VEEASACLAAPGSPRDSSRRDGVRELQRRRVLRAALELLAEGGYARLTVGAVVARARVSRRTFYHLFGDAEECFVTLFDEGVELARAPLREAYRSGCGWRESTRRGLACLLALIDADPALARVCVVDALASGPRALARRAAVLAELAGVVDRGRDRLAPGDVDPGPLAAEAAVGAVFSLLHARLTAKPAERTAPLLGDLMAIVVLPYLGRRAAADERRVGAATPGSMPSACTAARDPLEGLDMRVTHRTLRVLRAMRERPGASNRVLADLAGVGDQGQISKLLGRLARLGLAENRGEPAVGRPNAWFLTTRGAELESATSGR
jgi:AcrR family transcriptional regulator